MLFLKNNWKRSVGLLVVAPLLGIAICRVAGVRPLVTLRAAYNAVRGSSSFFEMSLDANGIPISDYGTVNGIHVGRQRSVVAVAEKALDYWNTYQLGTEDDKVLLSYDFANCLKNNGHGPRTPAEAREMFLNCVHWLLEHAVTRETYAVWEYSYSPCQGTTPPWRSGQAQAIGIQALLRAHELTGDSAYLACARKSLQAFYVSVEAGGVADKEPSGGWWYDKFADRAGARPKVLNGMMFALLGMHDYYKTTNDSDAQFLFDKGIVSLKQHLHEYDAGDWSYYDRLGRRASPKYHNIHIQQLSQLYVVTGDRLFGKYYERFIAYRDNQ